MKKPQQTKPEIWPAIVLGVFAVIIILFCLLSCRILQDQKGYEHYTKNKSWKLLN